MLAFPRSLATEKWSKRRNPPLKELLNNSHFDDSSFFVSLRSSLCISDCRLYDNFNYFIISYQLPQKLKDRGTSINKQQTNQSLCARLAVLHKFVFKVSEVFTYFCFLLSLKVNCKMWKVKIFNNLSVKPIKICLFCFLCTKEISLFCRWAHRKTYIDSNNKCNNPSFACHHVLRSMFL